MNPKAILLIVCSAALVSACGRSAAATQPAAATRKCWTDADKPGEVTCERDAPVDIFAPPPGRPVINPRALQRFSALRPDFRQNHPASPELIDLGRTLYYDARLSRGGTLSCNSCHPLERYGAKDEATSMGVDGKRGTRNAPTTYNAAGHFALFWDGRSKDVEEQALMPLLNPMEMGASAQSVLATIRSMGYDRLFRAAFPRERSPVTLKNVGVALGAFERGLTTPSRWDKFLRGSLNTLSDKEKEGLRLFTSVGCMVCHTGELVGGTMYEKAGAAAPWAAGADHGRAAITHDPTDEMMFKVPSLRNVAKTAPYFHDGSAATLTDAVRIMANNQLGQPLSEAEVQSIVAFLNALTGELPTDYIKPPPLPGTRMAGR
jgi:cytochrome c peroxidase